MHPAYAWDWEIKYTLGPKRCGVLGTVGSQARAFDRVEAALTALPQGIAAAGHIAFMGAARSGGQARPLVRMVASVERTTDGRILWSGRSERPR